MEVIQVVHKAMGATQVSARVSLTSSNSALIMFSDGC